MTTLSQRLQEVLDSGFSQVELSDAAKVTKGTANQWMNGGIKSMKLQYAEGIETLTGFSATWLVTGKGEKRNGHKVSQTDTTYSTNTSTGPSFRSVREYPVISWVQAGEWTSLCDNFHPGQSDEWRNCHIDLGECGYVLRVKGDSMTSSEGNLSFPEGMLLYVDPEAEALPGKFVIVRRNATDEATFKRLATIDGELYLEAINPRWPTRYLKLEKGDHICGVVRHAGFDMP